MGAIASNIPRQADPESPAAPSPDALHSASMASNWKPGVRRIAIWVLAALALGFAYSQSPLYTSNQNQYFLHGAAHAGIGFLSQDWLANTADPTPVFSWIVEWTYRLLPPAAFYIQYLLLFGVYLAGVWLLVDPVFHLRPSRLRVLLFLTLLVILHSAALRLLQGRLLGEAWEYLWDGGLAGQRLLGPVYQPSAFGVFLLLSLALFLRGRPGWASAAAALTACVHPTYLLPAAILVLAHCTLTWRTSHRLRQPLQVGLLALILVTPILLYVLLVLGPTSPSQMAQAQQILVDERVPHHALPAAWFDASSLAQLALVGLALGVTRRTHIFPLLCLVTATGVLLTVIQVLTGSTMLALLFPWRISTVLIPTSVGLLAGWGAHCAAEAIESRGAVAVRMVWIGSLAVIVLLAIAGAVAFLVQRSAQLADPATDVMRYARAHAQPGEIYLIPAKLQEFRLATGAPVLVDFKSIPYRDVDVLEWRKRLRLVTSFYQEEPAHINCSLLDDLAQRYGVTHAVLDEDLLDLSCPQLHLVYRDAHFALGVLQTP
jgi:hypothetical protein